MAKAVRIVHFIFYFDNKMVEEEEEEIEKQVNDGTFDECVYAYFKDDDNLCA